MNWNNSDFEEMTMRAVILTAIPVEYAAVRKHLKELRKRKHQGSIYEEGIFESEYGTWEVLIVEVGAGNPVAGIETERALSFYSPQVAFFVGVAGGLKKELKLGDIVVGDTIFGYEMGKITDGGFFPRPKTGGSDYHLVQHAQYEGRFTDWMSQLKGYEGTLPNPLPKVYPKNVIVSGEKVVASNRGEVYAYLNTCYSQAYAVEMEGIGFLVAVKMNQAVRGLVIRGISDMLSNKTASDEGGSQEAASAFASAFAFQILSKLEPSDLGLESVPGVAARPVVAVPARPAQSSLPLCLIYPIEPLQRPYFFPAKIQMAGNTLKLEVELQEEKEREFFQRHSQWGRNKVAVVFRHECFVGILQTPFYNNDGNQERWHLVVSTDQFAVSNEVLFQVSGNGYSAEQILERRGRIILLNENPIVRNRPHGGYGAGEMLDILVTGLNQRFPITHSDFPKLYSEYSTRPDYFLGRAKLLAVLKLIQSGVVSTINKLELELVSGAIKVEFEGKFPHTGNILRIEGVCPL